MKLFKIVKKYVTKFKLLYLDQLKQDILFKTINIYKNLFKNFIKIEKLPNLFKYVAKKIFQFFFFVKKHIFI